MYLVSIQTPNGNREFVAESIDVVLNQFSATAAPKVLCVKSVDYLSDVDAIPVNDEDNKN